MADSSQPTPEEVVRAFNAAWDTDGFEKAYQDFFTDDVVVTNPGMPAWKGKEDVLARLGVYLKAFRRPYAKVDLHHIAVNGNIVLTERTEHNRSADGKDVYSGDLMTRFKIEGDKISEWAEYYDPTPYQFGAAVPLIQLEWTQ
jgi:limonene-1,2-epoxide hydrolase